MQIKIIVPKFVESKVKKELLNHIKSLCYLLADEKIKVVGEWDNMEEEYDLNFRRF